MIFTAFSSMFGAGGSSVISRALGTGEKEKAKSKKSQCACLLCLHSVRDYHECGCIAGNGFHFEDSRYGRKYIRIHKRISDLDWHRRCFFHIQRSVQQYYPKRRRIEGFHDWKLLIPLLFILNYFFGLDGVIYSNAIADYGAVIVSYAVCIAYIRKMK